MLLIYRPRGWAIERETYANEVMEYINKWLSSPATTPDSGWLNNKNCPHSVKACTNI